MIYISQISPFSIQQVRSGDNLPFTSDEFTKVTTKRYFPVNQNIIFQFQSDTTTPDVIVNGSAVIPTNITPSGWDGEGNYVWQVSYTPTTTGTFKILIHEAGYFFESECLEIIFSCDGMLKISYKNSENDFGYVGTSALVTYQAGRMIDAQPENEIDSFQNDRGRTTILRATPIEAYNVSMYYADLATVNRMLMVFSCDTVTINGMAVEVMEAIKPEFLLDSDMFSISIKAYRANADYNGLNSTDDGLIFITDDSNINLINDNYQFVIL